MLQPKGIDELEKLYPRLGPEIVGERDWKGNDWKKYPFFVIANTMGPEVTGNNMIDPLQGETWKG